MYLARDGAEIALLRKDAESDEPAVNRYGQCRIVVAAIMGFAGRSNKPVFLLGDRCADVEIVEPNRPCLARLNPSTAATTLGFSKKE